MSHKPNAATHRCAALACCAYPHLCFHPSTTSVLYQPSITPAAKATTGKKTAAKVPAPKAGSKAGAKKADAKEGLSLDSVFVIHTASMQLKAEETQDLVVSAFPTEVRAQSRGMHGVCGPLRAHTPTRVWCQG